MFDLEHYGLTLPSELALVYFIAVHIHHFTLTYASIVMKAATLALRAALIN